MMELLQDAANVSLRSGSLCLSIWSSVLRVSISIRIDIGIGILIGSQVVFVVGIVDVVGVVGVIGVVDRLFGLSIVEAVGGGGGGMVLVGMARSVWALRSSAWRARGWSWIGGARWASRVWCWCGCRLR